MANEFTERVAAIAADRSHGSAEIARLCLALLADAAERVHARDAVELRTSLQRLAATLIASRPSMTAVLRLVSLWLDRYSHSPPPELHDQREAASRAARALIDESRAATRGAARLAARQLETCRTLLTYSYSSTVREAIGLLPADVHVMFSEGRPLNEGYRLAEALSKSRRKATLVTDAQLGSLLQRADAVLVGADSILTDGSLINKTGTLPIAATAAHFGVPFYTCCESYKLRTADMPEPTLERMSPGELGAPEWPGIVIENVYFDITPPVLISACMTETGRRIFPGYRDDDTAHP